MDGASILLGGDVIQAINGKKVITSDDLASAISSMKPGDKVSVQLVRGGKQVTVAGDARQAAEPGADRLTAQARPGSGATAGAGLLGDLIALNRVPNSR